MSPALFIDWTALAIVIEACLLVYLNSLAGEFVFDDLLVLDMTRKTHHTHSGGSLKDLWHLRYSKRALLYWTWRRDMLKHGFVEYGWHTTNLAIHVVSSALMYTILRWWFDPVAAVIGAVIFAVHPLGTASVSSISGRSSALCGMFYLAAIVAFLAGGWFLIIPLGYLGLKSKEEIVILPVSLALIEWYSGVG